MLKAPTESLRLQPLASISILIQISHCMRLLEHFSTVQSSLWCLKYNGKEKLIHDEKFPQVGIYDSCSLHVIFISCNNKKNTAIL